MANIEIQREQQQTEGIWQPKWLGLKGAWVCERRTRDDYGALTIETWGATLRAPDGTKRFSAAHYPLEKHARLQCDNLNAEQANG